MSAGLPDLVDCVRLAEDAARVKRVYALAELPRLEGLLAESEGALHAHFAFAKRPSGHPGVAVTIEAVPQLVCQRCMQGFGRRVTAASEIVFAGPDDPADGDSELECFVVENGRVSLRALAEEELLLALPLAPVCGTPLACGKAPQYAGGGSPGATGDTRRPFRALQDLLKKT
jgi:uncharacterized protein